MKLLLDSFWRAVAYCFHPRVLGLSVLPLLVAGATTLGLGVLFWESANQAGRQTLDHWSLVNAMLEWMSHVLGDGFRAVITPLIVVALAIPPLVAFTLVLVALWVMPAAVTMVSRRRFPALERRRGGSWWSGLAWSLLCTAGALLMVMCSLPLWLVPGLALVIPPLIWGWQVSRTMGYDTLAEHASASEREGLMRAHRWPMLVMGVVCGFLCGVPSMIWTFSAGLLILAPVIIVGVIWLYTMIFTFSALWFAHYGLSALAGLRAAELAMQAVQPGTASAVGVLPLVEEVPPHERFAPPSGDPGEDASNAL